MQAQTQATAAWWARSRGRDRSAWVDTYRRSLTQRHREQILEVVRACAPEDVLEVGCHCGPNLIKIAQALPGVSCLGIDVNAEAIAAGTAWAAEAGLSDRVKFHVGQVPGSLSALPDRCADVVLTCYTLAYLAPADLDAVLYDLGRLAAKAVIVAEPMRGLEGCAVVTPRAQSVTGYSEWAHDYDDASRWIGTWRGMTLTTSPVTPPVDRLNAILLARRGDGVVPSNGPMP